MTGEGLDAVKRKRYDKCKLQGGKLAGDTQDRGPSQCNDLRNFTKMRINMFQSRWAEMVVGIYPIVVRGRCRPQAPKVRG